MQSSRVWSLDVECSRVESLDVERLEQGDCSAVELGRVESSAVELGDSRKEFSLVLHFLARSSKTVSRSHSDYVQERESP